MRRTLILVLASFIATGCMSKAEVKPGAEAWRTFTDAVTPDLVKIYGALPEPSRTTRTKAIRDNEAALQAFEARVGIAPAGSGS